MQRLLLSVVCFAVAAALLGVIAHPIDTPAPYGAYSGFFVLAAMVATGIGVSLLCGRRVTGARKIKALCGTIVCWELLSLGLYLFHYHIGGRLVTEAYKALVGDPQADFGTYDHVAHYAGILTMTFPATVASLCVFNVLSRRKWQWKPALLTFIGWQVCVVGISIWSYENGFAYRISQIRWMFFGAPADVYSFVNLGLPRMIAWVISTAPIAWVALCLYPRDEHASSSKTT